MMRRALAAVAFMLVLSGCYGKRIDCLQRQIARLNASVWVNKNAIDETKQYAETANERIDQMEYDLNRYNVCPRQLDMRLGGIECALKRKKIKFGPEFTYRTWNLHSVFISTVTFNGTVRLSTHVEISTPRHLSTLENRIR